MPTTQNETTKNLTLEDIKHYLRVNISDDDTLLQYMLDASTEYIKGYVNKTDSIFTDLEKQAQLMIIHHWYDNRSAVIIGKSAVETPLAANILLDINRNIPI